MTQRVGILTGGGDVPGLNVCLKTLVYRLIDEGYEPVGVRKGWEGLINYSPDDPTTQAANFLTLTKNMVRAVDRTPGSFLHSSRIDPRRTPAALIPTFLREEPASTQDLTEHITRVVQQLGYEALLIIGDDDMLYYAEYLSRQGVPIIAIPKTIHNNIHGTDYTLGFSAALARGVSFIHELRALAGSREQIIVVETFGSNSGYSSLLMAYLADADRAIIPEAPYDPARLAELLMQDKRMTPSNYAVVTITDRSRIDPDHYPQYESILSVPSRSDAGIAGSGMVAAKVLQHIIGEEVFLQSLTYLLRTGAPDGQDLLGATNYAMHAVHLLTDRNFGRMTAFQQYHTWTDAPLSVVTEGEKRVDVDAWYDIEQYRPTDGLIWSA